MTGTYGMVTDGGEPFDIEIPAFSLDSSRRADDQLSGVASRRRQSNMSTERRSQVAAR